MRTKRIKCHGKVSENTGLSTFRFAQIIVAFIVLIFTFSCRDSDEVIYTVKSGLFRQTVKETGELMAINAVNISISRLGNQVSGQQKIVWIAENGARIKKGDTIITIDQSIVQRSILTSETMVENEVATYNKQKVEMENRIQELNSQLKTEMASFELKTLEMQRLKFEPEARKKIKELEFKQVVLRMEKLKRSLELKPKFDEMDLKIQEIRIIQRKEELRMARESFNKLFLQSPQDGLFQKLATFDGKIKKPGDYIYIGQIVACIPDISKMKVNTFINEKDISKLKTGMKTIIRLDALPEVPFNGVVTKISKACIERNSKKVFNVIVEVADLNPKLKPGMTVSCEFISYESENELFVPNNCIMKEKGKSFVILDSGFRNEKTEVTTGPSNNTYTIIKGNFKAGQKIIPPSQNNESLKL